MTTKHQLGETLDEEEFGASEQDEWDDIDAELDDEALEKELRKFEQLQSGILSLTDEQETDNNGVGNGQQIMEKTADKGGASESDMEIDELEPEIEATRKLNPVVVLQKTVNQPPRKRPVPKETLPIQEILREATPLAQQDLDKLRKQILRSQREADTEPEDDPHDPDFPSPGKRKRRRSSSSRSKARHSEPGKVAHQKPTDLPVSPSLKTGPQTAHPSRKHSLTNRSPLGKVSVVTSGSEKGSPSTPGTRLIKDNPFHTAVSVPKEKGDHQTKSPLNKTESRREELSSKKTPVRGPNHVRAIDFEQLSTDSRQTNTTPSKTSELESPCLSPKLQSSIISNPGRPQSEDKDMDTTATSQDDSQAHRSTIDITSDPPVKYCSIERIIQRKYKSTFFLDDEKIDITLQDRPDISSPDLNLLTNFYKQQTWLVVCNELNKFFCKPCLLSTSTITKHAWSLPCRENSKNELLMELQKHKLSPSHQESEQQLNALVLKKKSSIITDLLSNDFVGGTWTDGQKEDIIIKGRPRPILANANDENFKTNAVVFNEFYDKFGWICACKNTRKFYCWPCLLFSKDTWTCPGNISTAEAAALHHETSHMHMNSCFKLGKSSHDLRNKAKTKEEQIENVRNFVICLVDILCAEKKRINNAEFSPLDFADTLEFMSEHNEKLRTFMEEKTRNSYHAIAQIVPQYTPAITDSLEFLLKERILEEIRASNFISLIFDHSSGRSNKAVLTVIVRYVDGKGDVHERFVKLLNVGYNTPAGMLYNEVIQIISELQCRSSLVGFTYDGYLVKPGSVPDFNGRIQKLCPNAKFFHYSEHNFKRVLKQTLSHVPSCRRVLEAVKELGDFFENTPGARKILVDAVTAAEKSPCKEIWKSADFITSVFVYRAVITGMMETICISKKPDEWSFKTEVKALHFLAFLKDSTNRFFISLIARIFSAVEDLSKELDRDSTIENMKTMARHTILKLQKLGRNFDTVFDGTCSRMGPSEKDKIQKEASKLRDQFTNVVRLVTKLVKNRALDLEPGYFKMSTEPPSSSFAHYLKLERQNLILENVALPPNFSSTKLSNELKFVQESSTFSGLDVGEIMAQLNNYGLTRVLPELFKLLQLALTIPKKHCDTLAVPALRRISAFIETKKDINSTDALIWMEKDFLARLQAEPDFHKTIADRVMTITEKDEFAPSN